MRQLRLRSWMRLACAVATGVVLSAGPALADPQTKEVTGDSVRTRSGPGEYWYPTGKLNRGDKVVVVGKQFGWAEIKPPADQRSLILKSDVDLRSQLDPGGKGVVKGDQPAVVRACPIEEARSNRIQCYLRPGAEVTILSPWEKFYLIAPPAEATVFIKADFLAEPGTIAEPSHNTPPVATHTPTTEPEGTAATSTTRPETVEPVATRSTTQPVTTFVGLDIRARVGEDQKLIKQQLAKPLADRDYSTLIARMAELKVMNARTPIRGVNDYADAMIAYANRQTNLLVAVRTMTATRPDTDQVLHDAEASMVSKPADFFQAVGILNKSVALGSSLSMPNLHKLESMDGQTVLCYVVPESGADWSAFEGKQVQVTGRKRYRADWKIYMVRPDTIAMADKTIPAATTGTVPAVVPPVPPDSRDVLDLVNQMLSSTTAPDSQPETPRVTPPAPIPAPPVPPTGPEGTLRPLPPVVPAPVIPTLPDPATGPVPPTVPAVAPATLPPTSAPAGP